MKFKKFDPVDFLEELEISTEEEIKEKRKNFKETKDTLEQVLLVLCLVFPLLSIIMTTIVILGGANVLACVITGLFWAVLSVAVIGLTQYLRWQALKHIKGIASFRDQIEEAVEVKEEVEENDKTEE